MVLVRRKSDGLYYTNRGKIWKGDTGWTHNPQDCKPFVNEGGARKSFYSYIPYDKCTCGKKGRFGVTCLPSCYRTKTSRALFDANHSIVPVHVKVDL